MIILPRFMSPTANDGSNDTAPADQTQESRPLVEDTTATDRLREHFQALLPLLQQEWPEIARERWEATRGSLEELVQLIASQTSHTRTVVRAQLLELVNHVRRVREKPGTWDEVIHPLEEQLATLVDELRRDLGPRLKHGVRQQPLLSLSVAILAGFVTGLLLGSSRRER